MQLIATPIQGTERALILDILRGIAIFGILLNNIYGFSGYGNLGEDWRKTFSTYEVDGILNFLQVAFVEGKFYSLFSLLFGIGFSIILARNKDRGVNPLKIFYRRLAVLALVGFAHIYFLWEGDILLLYALIGCLLPLFRNCSDRTLIIWAAILILSPILIDSARLWAQWNPGDFIFPYAVAIDNQNGIIGEQWRTHLYKEGSGFEEWRNYQEAAFMYRYYSLLNNNRIPKVLGMFLVGFYVGRRVIYARLNEHKALLKKLVLFGFLVGIPASMAMSYFEGDDKSIYKSAWGMADTVSYAFSVVPLSLAYASAICLLWMKRGDGSRLKIFAPVGKMALTNYLMQSIIASSVFLGAGFGLGQQFGIVYCFLIAIAIYLLQIIYSHFWMQRFQYGPVEWIWRQLTYGKRLRIKKL